MVTLCPTNGLGWFGSTVALSDFFTLSWILLGPIIVPKIDEICERKVRSSLMLLAA